MLDKINRLLLQWGGMVIKRKSNYTVIVPETYFPKPSPREMSAAEILKDYFKADVKFIPRNNCKTPDLLINQVEWELKSPTGSGKRNLQHTLNRALKQSCYIIVDARFSKIHISKIKNHLLSEIKRNKRIKRLVLIDKQKNTVEISR